MTKALLTSFLPLRYASEVDVDFVRKAVRAVGQVAIKIDTAAERCVGVLMDLIETRVSYVVQEAVIVLKVSGPSPVAGERNLVLRPLRRIMGRILISTPRTSSGDTLTATRASSRRCAPTSTSWTSQRQRRPSFGLSESMPRRSRMPMSSWAPSSRRSRRRATP
jgi:hypothetical protein